MASPPDLLQTIDDLGPTSWTGEAYRQMAPEYPPLSGSGASAFGGRWNPQGIATIYLATSVEACVAEFMRLAQGQAKGIESFLPRDLHVVLVSELQVLDLSGKSARMAIGIEIDDIEAKDRWRCQEVGEAARYLGFQGVLAPSATHIGFVLAAFERNIGRGQLVVSETRSLDSLLS